MVILCHWILTVDFEALGYSQMSPTLPPVNGREIWEHVSIWKPRRIISALYSAVKGLQKKIICNESSACENSLQAIIIVYEWGGGEGG